MTGDQRVTAAIVESLKEGSGPTVLDLLEHVRKRVGGLIEGHEGSFHALLLALQRKGVVRALPSESSGLARYALGKADHAAATPVRAPSEVAGTLGVKAARMVSGLRSPEDRARIQTDIAAHLEDLERDARKRSFGSARTCKHLLRRADRKRTSVFFAADGRDSLRRFAIHEGPWILGAVIVFLVVRAFLAEVFVIPSGSMLPTLELGDRVVVVKPGGSVMPERWRICTFERWGTTYVKRAVGLGGEKLALVDGDVYLDDAITVKPEDVRAALRMPYAEWDFAADADLWARTEPAPGHAAWTYAGPPLWSAGLVGGGSSADVLLRDVYAHLEISRVEGEQVLLELAYRHPDGRTTGDEVGLTLRLGDELVAATLERPGGSSIRLTPAVQGGRPGAGPTVLDLSYVDGVLRARAAGWQFEEAVPVAMGLTANPVVRIERLQEAAGPVQGRPQRLVLDKDIHYSGAGDLGVPDPRSDDDPRSYAFQIPPEHVFFLGDNTYNSKDSRYRTDRGAGQLGPVAVAELIGPVSFRIWPPGRLGPVR